MLSKWTINCKSITISDVRRQEVSPAQLRALLDERDALREAAQDVSDALHEHNADLSGLASQYPAVYYVGTAIQRLRAVLDREP